MTKSGRLETGQVYTKKGWRRRILVRAFALISVVVAALALVGGWVVRALPGIAAAEISRLTNTQIEMGAVSFRRDASVSIDDLVIRPGRPQLLYDDAILRAENVDAKFSLPSLLLLAPRVTEIRIEGFTLNVQCDLDTGQWNTEGLELNISPGRRAGAVPAISLTEGNLRYGRVSGGQIDVAMSVPIEARLAPSELDPQRHDFEIATGRLSGGYGESRLAGSWQPGRFELAGGLSSSSIPSLERAWAVDMLAAELTYDEDRNYQFTLRVKDLHARHSPEVDAFQVFDHVAWGQTGPLAVAQRFFARYRPFGTVGEISVKASGNLESLNDSEITGKIVCEDVSLCDNRFPYAIDHLAGQVDFTQSMAVLHELSGRHGEVDIRIQGWTRGYGDERQYRYEITSDNMILDDDLYAALSPSQQRVWDTFNPRGMASADYRLTRSTPTDRRIRIAVDLKGVSAAYEQFPYPLEHLTGELVFEQEEVTVSEVVTHGDGPSIRLDGRVSMHDTDRPIYLIAIDARDVPLDATLRDALPAPQRRLFKQFDARGVVDVNATVFTADTGGAAPVTFRADVAFEETSLRVEGLPEALSDISAQTSLTPESVDISRATGRYGQSQVDLTGAMRFADDGQVRQYRLKIATKETMLDNELLEMLPTSLRQPISQFRPQGPVNLAMDLTQVDANEPPDYAIVVDCLGNRIDYEHFAYPLEDIRGTVAINTDAVNFMGVTARPALQFEPGLDPLIEITGQLSLAPATQGEGTFSLQARDLLLSEALGDALPKDFAGVYRDISPRGPLDVNLPTLRISNVGQDRKRIEFGGQAILPTCSLSISGTGAELCGVLQVDGIYDTKEGLSEGRVYLAADRLTIKDKDITNLTADIIYDPNVQTWSARHFLGDCYDGKVLGSLEIERVGPGVLQYLVTTAFNRVSLQPFLLAGKLAQAPERNYTSGTMNAVLSMGARVGDGSSRLGLCRVDVADMRVGKVSPLANLLAVLSLTEPTDYAFERMLIESYLRRNKLLITKFDLSGRNLAFTGGGTMDLAAGDVNLTLTGRGRRLAAAQPSLLQSLTEGIGGGVVRVEVTGKADSPKVETRTLPVIEDSLKILGTPR